MLTRPSAPNVIVYFDRSVGVVTLSSIDWIRTNCHDVPERLGGVVWALA
jgi:hypothetical protein